MQDLAQEARIVQAFPPKVYSATTAGDYVNMENYAKATLILETGTVTVGTQVSIRNAKTYSGSGATAIAAPFVGGKYLKNYTATSATSSTSVHYLVVGNSDDSTTFVATVDANALTNGYPYLNAYIVTSAVSGALSGTWVLHGARYQQDAPPDPRL